MKLNDSCDETRVVLLPVDPYLVHVYWKIASDRLEKAKQGLGSDYSRSRAALRFYDVTNVVFAGRNARSFFDVYVDLQLNNWYVNLRSPDRSYFVELGLKAEGGIFFSFARSDIVKTPCDRPAAKGDERYMIVAESGESGLFKNDVSQGLFHDRQVEPGKTNTRTEAGEAQPPKRSDPDLTEMSENRFVSGVSSPQGKT
ncbi:MAG: DUF4912 domain-containing protein [Deltaproteobacteria bacterium]|nr:DUF4912 domain-containing protein [Deltaproteobacteria bacterium]